MLTPSEGKPSSNKWPVLECRQCHLNPVHHHNSFRDIILGCVDIEVGLQRGEGGVGSCSDVRRLFLMCISWQQGAQGYFQNGFMMMLLAFAREDPS
jgi:hypothetical protein